VDHLQDADHIIILGEDGLNAQQGSFNHVQANPYLQSLLNPQSIPREKGEAPKAERALATSEQQATAETAAHTDDEQERTKRAAGEVEEQDDLLNRTGDMSLYWYYFKTVGWHFAGVALSLGILAAFSHLFPRRFIPLGGDICQWLLTTVSACRYLAEALGGS
jgi:hypothetical protein